MATTTSSSSVKMTKAQKFALIAEIAEVKNNPILAEFIAHEVELLSKKNSAEKKPTAQQEANAAIKANIIATMEADRNRMWTVSELLKAVPGCADLTNQRMSALVRQMVDAGTVKRTEDKRKAFFSLV